MKNFHPFARPYELKAVWLLGLKERSSGFVLIFPILKRNKQKIMQIILRHVANQSIIYTDSFSVYVDNKSVPSRSKLSHYEYTHFFVNHRYQFVSKIFNGIHINSIEREWRTIKSLLKEYWPKNIYVKSIGIYYFLYNAISIRKKKKLIIF